MLVPSSSAATPSQTSFSNPRQIVSSATASNQVMYTVPAGKKFQGVAFSNATGQSIAIAPAGGLAVTFVVPSVSASPTTAALPLTLAAGSTVKNISGTGNSQTLIGVETDA